MKKLYLTVMSLFVLLSVSANGNDFLRLWYDKPAAYWEEALPLGNGRLGAMIYGNPVWEVIQLNEETIWAGSPYNNINPASGEHIGEIQQLIFQERYKEANELIAKSMWCDAHGMPYQTAGSMVIDFPGHDNYSNLYRDLDISKAVARVNYTVDGVEYQREIFSSLVDQVVVLRLTASEPGKMNFRVGTLDPGETKVSTPSKNMMYVDGVGTEHEGVPAGIRFRRVIKVEAQGGKQSNSEGFLHVNNANSATIYVSIATNFVDYKDISGNEKKLAESYIKKVSGKPYETLINSHIAEYKKYFDRVTLDLGTTPQVEKPTNVRLQEFSTSFDPQLAALFFQYGRYLLISSSMPGTQPATLQGIWNQHLVPMWDSKYTANINTEMNYWPSEITNLSEMQDPFFRMLEEVAVTGQETARQMYNSRGWVMHHNTDLWRITGPVDNTVCSVWPSCAPWLCSHIWEKYLYTGDKDFLEKAYPLMKGASEFYVDFLVEDPRTNYLVVVPSHSPENWPTKHGDIGTFFAGVTMDNQLLFDLFHNTARASSILGTDREFADTLLNLIERLPPMQIGRYGQLQEWFEDWDDPDDKHRHMSHLWGLHPASQISPYKNPELFQAAKQSLLYRGDASTGWSMGWKVCLWARLLDGDHAYKLIQDQLSYVDGSEQHGEDGGTYANLFDAHPPFQIDGNFGCATGIAEMMVQSHDEAVHILPALPSVWNQGSVKGLKTKGGFQIAIEWSKGQADKIEILSTLGGNLRLRSYYPLKGEGLKPAVGKNPNKLMENPEIAQYLVSKELKVVPYPELYKVFEYDIETKAGQTYYFTR